MFKKSTDKAVDPTKALRSDILSGMPKHEAFSKYRAAQGEPIRGSMIAAMLPDAADRASSRWLVYLMLALYWVPILGLYTASALQGNFAVIWGHFFWPTVVTYFLIRHSSVSYYFFIFLLLHTFYVAFNSNVPNPLFVPLVGLYCAGLTVLTVYTKMRLYPYQSFFHQKKNPNDTYVYTAEKDEVKPVAQKRRKRR
ncbi:hypothetical protein [Reinekea marinisedimentorum]|uniref:Uncharacterized protein n=1 Tax=Reinekea marinisedimentorum TaxID=230495 RepID=A0A4R3I4N1_9GAMM|nr:hypothetical protein [Reinekea marinisedimentorum]TCS40186.1 hypothetical protein BCF53_110108 [Reinekea marinisedimentorum]